MGCHLFRKWLRKIIIQIIFNPCSGTFDENTPPTNDPEYISTLGAAVFKAMYAGDSDAIWLM